MSDNYKKIGQGYDFAENPIKAFKIPDISGKSDIDIFLNNKEGKFTFGEYETTPSSSMNRLLYFSKGSVRRIATIEDISDEHWSETSGVIHPSVLGGKTSIGQNTGNGKFNVYSTNRAFELFEDSGTNGLKLIIGATETGEYLFDQGSAKFKFGAGGTLEINTNILNAVNHGLVVREGTHSAPAIKIGTVVDIYSSLANSQLIFNLGENDNYVFSKSNLEIRDRSTGSSAAGLNLFRASGTSTPNSDSDIGIIRARAQISGGVANIAAISFKANGVISASNWGGHIIFQTTQVNTNTLIESMRLSSQGLLTVTPINNTSTGIDVIGYVKLLTPVGATATDFLTTANGVIASVPKSYLATSLFNWENITASNSITVNAGYQARRISGSGNMIISHNTGAGHKHIPAGGATGNFLKWSAAGTASWGGHGLNAGDVGAEPVIAPRLATDYWNGSKAWINFNASVRSSTLDGFSLAGLTGNDEIVAENSVLTAFQRTQAQINNLGNIISSGLIPRPAVNCVFDNPALPLPVVTSTIDGFPIAHGSRVLVRNTNDSNHQNMIVIASLDGSIITWDIEQDGTGQDLPQTGHRVFVLAGTVNKGFTYAYNGDLEEWVKVAESAVYTAGNFITIADNAISVSISTPGALLTNSGSNTAIIAPVTSNFQVPIWNGINLNYGQITNDYITANAAIAWSKLADGASADAVVITDASSKITTATMLSVSRGGTNIDSYTIGDILFASGPTALNKLPIGATNNFLRISSGLPSWSEYSLPSSVNSAIGKFFKVTSNTEVGLDFIGEDDLPANIPRQYVIALPSNTFYTLTEDTHKCGKFPLVRLMNKEASPTRYAEYDVHTIIDVYGDITINASTAWANGSILIVVGILEDTPE